MTRIIALTGPAGSGKDLTAEIMMAQMLKRNFGVKIHQLSFAEPIKKAVASILGCSVDLLDDREFKEGSLTDSHDLDVSPREMMQLLGDDFARQMIDQKIWIKTAQHKFDLFCDKKADYVFITDLRYENEHKWVLENGGVVIYVDRQNAEPINNHASEAGLSRPPCFVLDNNSCIDSLKTGINALCTLVQPSTHQRNSIDDCTPAEWDSIRGMY
jgi:hypothetical protein